MSQLGALLFVMLGLFWLWHSDALAAFAAHIAQWMLAGTWPS